MASNGRAVAYQAAWPHGYDRVACPMRRVEHFHRDCQRCHYGWTTDDVLARSLDSIAKEGSRDGNG